MRVVEEAAKIVQGPVACMDGKIIGDVVSIIAQRGGIKGKQPNCSDSEVAEVSQFSAQPAEIADAIVVAIGESFDVELVNDCVLEPKRFVLVHAEMR
jgi:hypothetical protein